MIIKKGKVYKGAYFYDYAVMALDESYDADDFIKVFCFHTEKERYVYAHQLELMQDDEANEYLFSNLPDDFYDNMLTDVYFGIFDKLATVIKEDATISDINDAHFMINETFIHPLINYYDFQQFLSQRKNALEYIYLKGALLI